MIHSGVVSTDATEDHGPNRKDVRYQACGDQFLCNLILNKLAVQDIIGMEACDNLRAEICAAACLLENVVIV